MGMVNKFVSYEINKVPKDQFFGTLFYIYTKHHLKFGKNQADNLEYIGFRRRFFPVFYWCLVLGTKITAMHKHSGYDVG